MVKTIAAIVKVYLTNVYYCSIGTRFVFYKAKGGNSI
jgi:hypothetical protein